MEAWLSGPKKKRDYICSRLQERGETTLRFQNLTGQEMAPNWISQVSVFIQTAERRQKQRKKKHNDDVIETFSGAPLHMQTGQ